jgi:hypothetical protein
LWIKASHDELIVDAVKFNGGGKYEAGFNRLNRPRSKPAIF